MKTQFLSLSLADQRAMLKDLREAHTHAKTQAKIAKEASKALKAEVRATKQAQAIAKAEARLQKLLAKQAGLVGSKAAKANRKAGPVTTTYGAEDNAIAAAIQAKKLATA